MPNVSLPQVNVLHTNISTSYDTSLPHANVYQCLSLFVDP